MPIIRSSDQKNKTLEEFYEELKSDEATSVENEIGESMLSFISMVNQTFTETQLYGLTSHYSLVIRPTDNWEDDRFVTVSSGWNKTFQIEYKMTEGQSPWQYAVVKGQANTIQEAIDYLIIAMTESEGWPDSKQLKKYYNKLKRRTNEVSKFTLWLEFEEVDPDNWDIENEFCNVIVNLEDGRKYGLNIWTYKFLETAIKEDLETGKNLNGLYQKPPDLFVKELTRECIERSIQDLLKIDDLEKVLNPSIKAK